MLSNQFHSIELSNQSVFQEIWSGKSLSIVDYSESVSPVYEIIRVNAEKNIKSPQSLPVEYMT